MVEIKKVKIDGKLLNEKLFKQIETGDIHEDINLLGYVNYKDSKWWLYEWAGRLFKCKKTYASSIESDLFYDIADEAIKHAIINGVELKLYESLSGNKHFRYQGVEYAICEYKIYDAYLNGRLDEIRCNCDSEHKNCIECSNEWTFKEEAIKANELIKKLYSCEQIFI
jgi:hypothetical protein